MHGDALLSPSATWPSGAGNRSRDEVDCVEKSETVPDGWSVNLPLSVRDGLPVIRPESMPPHSFWPYPQCRIRKAKQILATCAVDRLHGHTLIEGSDKSGKIGGICIVWKVTF